MNARDKADGAAFIQSIGADFFGAWLLMLAFGIVHGSIAAAVRPIGYWPAFGLVAAYTAVVGAGRLGTTFWLRRIWQEQS